MDQQQDKNKAVNKIKTEIERNKSRIFGDYKGGSSVSSDVSSEDAGGLSGGANVEKKQQSAAIQTGKTDTGDVGPMPQTSGNFKGQKPIGPRQGGLRDKFYQNPRVQDMKKKAADRVKNSAAYARISKIQEDANRIKQEAKAKAEEQIVKIGGERAKQALEIKRKANIVRNKINKRVRDLKKALAVKAKKSHASGKSVILVLIVTLSLATVVDLIDVFGEVLVELGAVPTIIAYLINFGSSTVITALWLIVFSGSRGKSTRQTKMIIRSIILLFGLESVPIVELLPFNTIAVILNYIDYKAGQKEENQ